MAEKKQDGIYENLDFEEYLKDVRIGSSDMKVLLHSPADFKANLSRKKESTRALNLGTAYHTLTLEPEKFDSQFALQPEDWGPKNKGEGKKKWDLFKKEAAPRIPLSFEDSERIKLSSGLNKRNLHLQSILKNSKVEVSCFYGDFKARPDIVTNDGFIWDLKTTREYPDHDNLSRVIFKMGYHFQAAHYIHVLSKLGVHVKGYGWIFISTETPHPHTVFKKASSKLLNAGSQDHLYCRDVYKTCCETGDWYGFHTDIEEIDLPDYAMRIYENG